jgi:hypothetical protein
LESDAQRRLKDSPVVKVARWTVPWVLVGVVAWYLWGFYSEFKTNARTTAAVFKTAEEVAAETTSSVDASGTPLADVVGVVLVDGVRLRTTPTANGQMTASVGKETTLTLIEKKGDWYRAKDPLGRIGWVTASDKFIKIVPIAKKK